MKYKVGDKIDINGENVCVYSKGEKFYLCFNEHNTFTINKFFEKCGTTRDYIEKYFGGSWSDTFPEIHQSKLDELINFLKRDKEPIYEIY